MPIFASDAERAQVDLELHEIPSRQRRNKIQLGSMTNEDFRWWILEEASQSIQDSKITHVTWWEERHTVLKHQFIIMRFEHAEYGNPTTKYEVRLERAGKAIFSLASRAIDKATISTDKLSLGNITIFKDHRLLFALLNDDDVFRVPDPGDMDLGRDESTVDHPSVTHIAERSTLSGGSVSQGTIGEGRNKPISIIQAGGEYSGTADHSTNSDGSLLQATVGKDAGRNQLIAAAQAVGKHPDTAERSTNADNSVSDGPLDEDSDRNETTTDTDDTSSLDTADSLASLENLDDVFYYNAFKDFLDHKWRGPPLKLFDVARYLDTILEQNVRYSLAGANCFWYARLIMHTIALRHYSFPILATSTEASKYVIPRTGDNIHYGTQRISRARWRRHDPSSISLLFRYLHYEEWRNGILMYRRLVLIIVSLLYLAVGAALGYALYRLYFVRDPSISKGAGIFAVALLGVAIMLFFASQLKWPVRKMIAGLTFVTIRKGTEKVVDKLDRKFTTKEAARGDYVPMPIPLVRVRTGFTVVFGGQTSAVTPTYTMEVDDKPRKLPQPWGNEAQIFVEKRRDYDAAFRSLMET
ncbi:hypothetical protein C8J57DRAFT_1321083 [Mycena rebaudengoi]|nr:hypothetical protein C8J57DRAFT_1321083 [Mycena rebaudengoi]